MRVLVTGAAGMLGTDLVTAFLEADHEVTGLTRRDLDVTDGVAVADSVAGHDVVVNAAAWTAVDDAETDEPAAFAVNALGAQLVARAAERAAARCVQVSTDYVFGEVHGADPGPSDPHRESLAAAGVERRRPWPADAALAPLSGYGRTKAAGEWAARSSCRDTLVVRTAWLYGAHGPCFPRTMVRLAGERGALRVVDDQHGQPTWTSDVAGLLVRLLAAGAPPGTYHATSSGWTTWFGFAREVVAAAGHDAGIVSPTTTDAFPRPARRPSWSVLAHDTVRAAGVRPIGPWRERWAEAAAEVLA